MKIEKIDITHGFKIHTPQLLKEITNNNGIGALKIPLRVLQRYLVSVAERTIELDDPIMNKIMCEMTLYDQVDPQSKTFQPNLMDEVNKKAEQFKKSQ